MKKLLIISAFIILIIAWFLSPKVSFAAISFVQVASSSGSTGSTVILLPNVAAGDTLVFIITTSVAGTTVSSISDTKSNTYNIATNRLFAPSVGGTEIRYVMNAKGGNTTTTINYSATVSTGIEALEYSGIVGANALDATSTASSTSGTVFSSGTSTTSNANDLIIGAFGWQTAGGATVSPGSGFSQRAQTSFPNMEEDKTVAATGNYSASATRSTSTGNWVAEMATFKAALTDSLFFASD